MAKSHRVTADALKAEVAALKQQLPDQEAAEREQLAALQLILAALPNLPAADVPDGEDEAGNVEIARWGTLRDFDFQPQEHADRSEEHTSELQSLMRNSYAVFCLKKKNYIYSHTQYYGQLI